MFGSAGCQCKSRPIAAQAKLLPQFRVPDTDALPLKKKLLLRGPSPRWRDDFKIIIKCKRWFY
jgi:hypothetical protein